MQTEHNALLDTLATLKKFDPKNYQSYLNTLNIVATLMNLESENRFDGASYSRVINHKKLSISISFKGERSC